MHDVLNAFLWPLKSSSNNVKPQELFSEESSMKKTHYGFDSVGIHQ